MTRVTIKPRTGGHAEWPNGKQVIYTSDSPPFEVSEKAFATFRNKFILVDEPESPEIDVPEDKEEPVTADTSTDETEAGAPAYVPFDASNTSVTDVMAAIEDGKTSFNVPNTSITDVMAAIEAGQIPIEDALDQETKADRPRQSLIRKLSSSILKDGE